MLVNYGVKQATDQKCVWMECGLVSYKLCDRNLDCDDCPLDRALRMRKAEIHTETGTALRSIKTPGGLPEMELAEHCFYGSNHVWARVEHQGRMRVGLDDLAQRVLGPVHGLDLPPVGTRLTHNDSLLLVNSLGSVTLELPTQGTVTWVNPDLEQKPGLINESPYGSGSLMVLEPDNLTESLKNLRFGEDAEDWFRHETEKLAVDVARVALALRSEVGATLPDGGAPYGDWLQSVRQQPAFYPVVVRYLSRNHAFSDRRI